MSAIVYYHRASCMAPNKVVAHGRKKFRPTKGFYAVNVEDEVDFLAIPCIAAAVNSSRMWRAGPYYQASDFPEEEISAPEPTPEPVTPVRRGRKKDVPITDSVDQGDIQPERPGSRSERANGLGSEPDTSVESDIRPDAGIEDVQLRGSELDRDGADV